ncbi:Fc.00g043250.m01.CDS01 [Cosmosporella sp. VM-42]
MRHETATTERRRLPFSLSIEAIHNIYSFLPQATLKKCRLLSRDSEALANVWAFRHIRLTPMGNDAKGFFEVAVSEKLCPLVREVTCDTWLGPAFRYGANESYRIPESFIKALPYLQLLSLTTTLNLRFNELTGNPERSYFSMAVEETYDFRFRVLDTVFQCLAGTWSAKRQDLIDEDLALNVTPEWDPEEDSTSEEGLAEKRIPAFPEGKVQGPIPVQTITVSNLGDYSDKRLTEGEAFRKVINSGTVKDLKLCIAVERDEAAPENAIKFPEKYELFRSLPKTWLSPILAENLRVLSLYCQDYWGWNPPMHFRDVNSESGGFPNLRVLALGNYVFSHEWQIDWIASLGSKNSRGGLEELYLEECPVMYHARLNPPHLRSMMVAARRFEGRFLIDGYPLEELVTDKLTAGTARGSRTIQVLYSVRWHTILRQWKEKMNALKVFKMGRAGDRDMVVDLILATTNEAVPGNQPLYACGSGSESAAGQPYTDNEFRYFDCPTPPPEEESINYDEKYRFGVGIDHRWEYKPPYVYFDMGLGPTQWIGTTYEYRGRARVPMLGVEAKEPDKDALQSLLETVNRRRMGELPIS